MYFLKLRVANGLSGQALDPGSEIQIVSLNSMGIVLFEDMLITSQSCRIRLPAINADKAYFAH